MAKHPDMRKIEAYRQTYGSESNASASNISAQPTFKARLLYLRAQYAEQRASARVGEDWPGFLALYHDLIRDLEELVDLASVNGVDASGVRGLIVSLAGKLITSEESLALADKATPELIQVPEHLRKR